MSLPKMTIKTHLLVFTQGIEHIEILEILRIKTKQILINNS